MKLKFPILTALAVAMVAFVFASCSSTNEVKTSAPFIPPPGAITKDTISGTLKGVLLADSTYYMPSSVRINAGDTLLIQHGVKVIMLNTSLAQNPTGSPEFQVFGTLISEGQQGDPVYLTVPPSLRQYAALTDATSNSLWGGIQCAGPTTPGAASTGSGDLILKWTHIEFAGGSASTTDPIVTDGGSRYAVWFQSPGKNFVMEDSWVTGSTDDPIRLSGGQVYLMRNVVECTAFNSGDFNMKSGTVGDIAYNLFIGIATNGSKLANTGGVNPECNVNIYNNTYINDGWRCTKTGRAGSIDIEAGARGVVYNNLIVNCRTGYRMLGDASVGDTANTVQDYDFYYGSNDTIVTYFNPGPSNVGGIQTIGTHDVHGAAGTHNPKFVNYDVDQFNAQASTLYSWPTPWSAQKNYAAFNVMRSVDEKGNQRFTDVPAGFKSDFHLATASPCINGAYSGTVKSHTGSTLPIPLYPTLAGASIKSASNLYGADYSTLGLGKDFGAYQVDNSGNQQ